MTKPLPPPLLMTQAQYAAHRGCAPRAVERALKRGLIHFAPGTRSINPERADIEWTNGVNPAINSRPGHKGNLGAPAAYKPDAGSVSFVEARTRSELAKANLGDLRLAERRGVLVDKRKMLDVVVGLSRQYRDELAALPARVAAEMAGALKIDPHLLETALDRMIKSFLKGQSEPDVERLAAMLAPRPKGNPQ